ncbi:hypothetical protein QC764_0097450 [Podospora pseudoanserina]|uniref:Uncharacterized protein n=1 Tax=Podospora pseudoanserina TaxID=2609844 RepID=A0ABR0HUL5_9PEZI|nr:hypothetical protein QC764_0097450 [Podospora pseudoanserina]
MPIFTNEPRNILGYLTTTFTAPEACWTPAHNTEINVGWLGQRCGPNDVQDNADCWPPRTTGAPRTNLAFYGWGFYSPGLHCPAGYVSACTASATFQGWRVQYRMEPEETFVGCCPEGYACHNENGQTCISNARATTISTYQCESGSQINLAPMTLPNKKWSQVNIYAPMIQLAWKPSDLPSSAISSDPGPTNTSAPEEPSSGGISSGAIAGIAVGAVAVVIAIVVGAFLLWRTKRRGLARGGTDSKAELPITEAGAPPPGSVVSGPGEKYYYSGQPEQQLHPGMKEPQMTTYELGQTQAPAELSSDRWDTEGRVEAPGPEIAPRELESAHGTPPAGQPAALHRGA